MRRLLVFVMSGLSVLLPLSSHAQQWKSIADYQVGIGQIHHIALADVDGDNVPDALVVDISDLWMLRGDGHGEFAVPAVIWRKDVTDVVTGDFTGKGSKQVVVLGTDDSGSGLGLFLLGAGNLPSFSIHVPTDGIDLNKGCLLSSGDYDGDGSPDIAIACPNDSQRLYVGLNSGNGVFVFTGVAITPNRDMKSISSGDLDGDGKADLVLLASDLAGTQHSNILWSVDGKTFSSGSDKILPAAINVFAGDFNGDGYGDIVTFNARSFVPSTSAGGARSFTELQPINGASECITDVGVVATVSPDWSVRALDAITGETCGNDSQPYLRLYRNLATTSTSLEPTIVTNRGRYLVSMRVNVTEPYTSTAAVGSVAIGVNGVYAKSVLVRKGTATTDLQLRRGMNSVTVVYCPEDNAAISQSEVYVYLPFFGDAPVGVGQRSFEKSFGGATYSFAHPVTGDSLALRHPRLRMTSLYSAAPSLAVLPVAPNSVAFGTSISFSGSSRSTLNETLVDCTGTEYGPGVIPLGSYSVLIDGVSSGGMTEALAGPTQKTQYNGTKGCLFPINYVPSYTYTLTSTLSNVGPGTHLFAINYISAGNITTAGPDTYQYSGGTSASTSFTVGMASPSVSVTATPSSLYSGSNSTFVAIVSGGYSPSGTVTYSNGAGWTQTVGVGSASSAAGASWAVGGYNITATYNGDSRNNAASATTPFVVNSKITPSVSVSCSPNPITYGPQTTNCTAHVSGGSGTISFTIDGNPWFTGTVDGSGNVSGIGFNNYPAGAHTIGVTSSGDASYMGAIASTVLTINKAPSTVGVSCSLNPIIYGGGNTNCTATVTGGATGSVTFFANGGFWTTVSLTGNTASAAGWGGGSWPAGTYPVGVTYNGDTNYATASSSVNLTISKATPTISVSCVPNPITYGSQNTNCTSSLSGGFAVTGSETWTINGGGWTTTGVNGNAGGFAGYAAGSYTIGVSYGGDANNNGTPISYTTLTINKASTSTTGGFAANPIIFGQALTVQGQVSCNSACGTMQFFIDGNSWGTNTLGSSGAYGAAWGPAAVGTHSILVNYLGDANHNASSWGPATLTVVAATTPTTTTGSISSNPITYGQNYVLSGHVSCNTACGSVNYLTDGGVWGTTAVDASGNYAGWYGGLASVGNHPVQVNYLGNANFSPSSWGPATLTVVAPIPTVTELSTSANPISFGGSTTFTALVDTGGTFAPTGSVSFTSNGTALGSGVISTVSATNLALYSSQIEGAGWGGFCMTTQTAVVNTPAVLAPDGTATATSFVMPPSTPPCGGGGNQGALMWISGGLVPGNTYTASVWLRGAVGGESVNMGLDDGHTQGFTLTTSWKRYAVTFPNFVSIGEDTRGFQFYGMTSNEIFYAWGPQTEAASFAGPYVATGATSVTGSGGKAILTPASLATGSDTILASYGGDAHTVASTSSPLLEVVTKATPTVTVSCVPAPISYGATSSCSGHASGGGGTIVWTYNGGIPLTSNTVVDGSGNFGFVNGFTGAYVGTYTITAAWNGNSDYSASSGLTTLVVNKAALSLTASSATKSYGTANPVFVGLPVGVSAGDGITAFCTSGATTATAVGVYSSGVNAIACTLVDPNGKLGNYTVTQNLGTLTITQASQGLGLTSSANPAVYGNSATFTAQYGSTATGIVTFYDGVTVIGTGGLSAGSASYSLTTLAGGAHSITATYAGDVNYLPAVSSPIVENVLQSPITGVITSTVNPSAYGATTTFTLTFTGLLGHAIPSGQVELSDGGSALSTLTLDAAGRSTYTISTLKAGMHTLSGKYGGDSNYR